MKQAHRWHHRETRRFPDGTRTRRAKMHDITIRKAREARGRGVLPTVPAEGVA